MAKINVLTSDIYNLISAGEVVESPCSVVKELVENSLDAKATSVTVEVFNGGISEIIVTDDGCGIESSEIEKVFKKHATSKIATKEDIYKISTLGFRGEALSSISLVSNVVLTTKYVNEEFGTQIEVEGGEQKSKKQMPANNGTKIDVSKLFYNTPARYKFLKESAQEYRQIYKLICTFILAYPHINFKLIADGKLKLTNKSGNLESAIFTIYGSEFTNNLIRVNEKFEEFQIDGAITLPYVSRPNHGWQTVFINNRCVECIDISAAVNAPYADFLMKGRYAGFVLNLTVPYEDVDVNISPQKTIVKLKNKEKLSNWLMSIFRDILADNSNKQEKMEAVEDFNNKLENFENNNQFSNPNFVGYSIGELLKDKNLYNDKIVNKINGVKEVSIIPDKRDFDSVPQYNIPVNFEDNEFSNEFEVHASSPIMNKIMKYSKIEEQNEEINEEKILSKQKKDADISHIYSSSLFASQENRVVGVLYNTYIVVEQEDNFCLIDQHAVHEKFLFDSFMEEIEKNEVPIQQMLIPFKYDVTMEEKNFLLDNSKQLSELGFDVQDFGLRSIIITQVPLMLADCDLNNFFDEILSDLNVFSRDKVLLKHKLATRACKHAIKAGDMLNQEEIDKILDMVKKSKTPLLCPHGRPYVVSFSKNQIEKWFKRVL